MESTIDTSHAVAVPSRKKKIRWSRLLIFLVVMLFAGFLSLGLWPAPADFHGDESTAGVGSGNGGLDRPFPAMIVRADSPVTEEKIRLGRLLFFDPVLSGDNDISCATCHHPDL